MDQDGSYHYSGGEEPRKGKKKWNLKWIPIIALVLLAVVAVESCVYTVDDKQQAVVTTFGKVTGVTDAGVHFRLPFGIQRVQKVDVNVYQKIQLGYSTPKQNNYVVDEGESAMITGDYNIVNVDFFVEYKISDPVQYLYASNEPELILRNLIQSQVRNVVGSSTVDAVLTEATEQVAMFTARYQEYANDPQITRSRMYYEAISEILPGVKLYINTGAASDVQMLLPLGQLMNQSGGEADNEN